MSYSRWSSSDWYTYWMVGCGYKKEDQGFNIVGLSYFTYKQLVKNIDKCLEKTKVAAKKQYIPEVYEALDFKELKGYMEEFIKDIEKDEQFFIKESN